MQSESALRQAVEEQLDLILKIEEERKLLKRENKTLKEEHHKMLNIIKKYGNIQKTDAETETDPEQKEDNKVEEKVNKKDMYAQVDLELSQLNTSKLSIAQELLKKAPTSRQTVCLKCEENKMNVSNIEEVKKKQVSPNSQQVGNEIVKMAKEISSLKKLLSDSEKQCKNREK